MPQSRDLKAIKADTLSVYDRNARAWDEGRSLVLREQAWLDRLLSGLQSPGDVLDLGCGAGRPLGSYVAGLGHRLTGIDGSAKMIARARENVPRATWLVMDMRDLHFDARFDAVFSWDGFFHLSPDEQRLALPAIAGLVRSGGSLLLTVGEREGEVTGTVAGEQVFHGSLSVDEYRELLEGAGFAEVTFTANDPTVLGRNVLFASQKNGAV
jgi:SAM-dependent methyltransferase